MPDANATIVPAGATSVVPPGQSASDYVIYGTVQDAGILSDAEVGETGPAAGVLYVEPSGSASDVTVDTSGGTLTVYGRADGITFLPETSGRGGGQLSVEAGGLVTGVTAQLPPLSSPLEYANPPGGAGTFVAQGGELDDAQMYGYSVGNAVDGVAKNLTLGYGANLTITGSVTGLNAQGYSNFVQYGYDELNCDITVYQGGTLTDATLGQGTVTQLNSGSVLTGASLSGGFSSYNGDSNNNGAQLALASGAVATGVTATGTASVTDAGSLSGLTLNGQAVAVVTGKLTGATVTAAYTLGSIFATPPLIGTEYGGGSVPSYYPTGLVVGSGGTASGVTDDGLEVIQAGGTTTGDVVNGSEVIFGGGEAVNATVGAAAQVLSDGMLLYTGSGTTTDAGDIVTATVYQPFNEGYYTGIPFGSPYSLTFGTGTVVQDGPGRLVLAGNDTYTGGTTLERGTLEIASPTGAGTGPITFVPDGQLQVLQLDRAALAGGTFATPVQGFGLGSVVDLAGTAYRPLESAFVSGGHLDVVAPGDKPVASIDVGASGAPGVTFLALPDLHGGTAVVALPDALLAGVASEAEKALGASLPTLVADLASTPIGEDVVGSILKDLTGQTSVGTLQLASVERSLPSAVQAIVKSVGGVQQVLARFG